MNTKTQHLPRIKTFLFYLLILIFSIAYSIDQDLIDADFYSRLIQGRHVIETGVPMFNDIISYSKTHIWYDHEWLSSALFFLILTKFYTVGLTVFKGLICFFAIIIADFTFKLKNSEYRYRLAYIIIFMGLLALCGFWGRLRCQHFTFLFYPLLIFLLEKVRLKYNSRAIYFIPLLMLFWLNTHGGCMYGIGIIGLYIIGEFLNKKQYLKYIYILVPSLLVYLINPWGVDFIGFMISTLGTNRSFIAEWQPFWQVLNVLDAIIFYVFFYLFMLIVFLFHLIKTKKFDFTKILIVVLTAVIAVKYTKFHPLFLFSAFVFMYEDFKFILDKIKFKLPINPVLILIVISYCMHFSIKTHWYPITASLMPLQAMQFLRDNNLKGKILIDFEYSGYIAYRFYPDYTIHIDGRQEEVYTKDVIKENIDFWTLSGINPLNIVNKYMPDIILVQNKDECAELLLYGQDYYKLVYQDERYSVFLSPENVKFNYIYSNSIPDFSIDKFFDTSLNFKYNKKDGSKK